jgi:signal transduction histidine kinase
MTIPLGGLTLLLMAGTDIKSFASSARAGLAASWLRPLAIVTVTAIVALSIAGHPSPALHGGGLAVLIALAVLVLAAPVLRPMRGGRGELLALVTLIAASGTLLWTQGGGAGIAGLFIAAGYAAARLPTSRSLPILVLTIVALAVGTAAHGQRSFSAVAASVLGLLAFYVFAAFARRVQEDNERTKGLLAELEASRRLGEEAAALRERSRIAREIHDLLAHSLSGLMLQLEGARMLAARPNPDGQLPAALERAHHLAGAGLAEARRAIGALRDEELPGPDGLDQLAAEFSRDSSIEATLDVSGTPCRLDSQRSLTLYRVAQEALTNARKHARPERVELHLAYEPEGARLVIQDHEAADRITTGARGPDGDPADSERTGDSERTDDSGRTGYGLTGMRERAELIGGSLRATPTADGFRVELWIPA